MENLKKEDTLNKKENDIVFTKTLKAGKRIYYLDVKKNKKDESFSGELSLIYVITSLSPDVNLSKSS